MNYFEHNATKGGRKDISLDVIEFTPDIGIEVEEREFENTGQFRAFIAEQVRQP